MSKKKPDETIAERIIRQQNETELAKYHADHICSELGIQAVWKWSGAPYIAPAKPKKRGAKKIKFSKEPCGYSAPKRGES